MIYFEKSSEQSGCPLVSGHLPVCAGAHPIKFVAHGIHTAQRPEQKTFWMLAPYSVRVTRVRGKPYNAYEVVKPLEVNSGPAIPWFNQKGMGLQYELPKNIDKLVESGSIRKVTPKNNVEDL